MQRSSHSSVEAGINAGELFPQANAGHSKGRFQRQNSFFWGRLQGPLQWLLQRQVQGQFQRVYQGKYQVVFQGQSQVHSKGDPRGTWVVQELSCLVQYVLVIYPAIPTSITLPTHLNATHNLCPSPRLQSISPEPYLLQPPYPPGD
jgi:hypothetical protein